LVLSDLAAQFLDGDVVELSALERARSQASRRLRAFEHVT